MELWGFGLSHLEHFGERSVTSSPLLPVPDKRELEDAFACIRPHLAESQRPVDEIKLHGCHKDIRILSWDAETLDNEL